MGNWFFNHFKQSTFYFSTLEPPAFSAFPANNFPIFRRIDLLIPSLLISCPTWNNYSCYKTFVCIQCLYWFKAQAIIYLKCTLLNRKIRALMGHIFTMNFILMRFCNDIMSFNVAEICFSRVSSFSFVVDLQLKDIMFLTCFKSFFTID